MSSLALNSCGSMLESLLDRPADKVILVAPFIKTSAMQRVLQRIRKDSLLEVYTRWRPDEVATGVSDLEVFDLVERTRSGKLYITLNLHAKYYRVDDRVLIGSANLTSAAMGWIQRPNLELMVFHPWSKETCGSFEALLSSYSVRANEDLQKSIRAAADKLAHRRRGLVGETTEDSPAPFIPSTRNPELLYRGYIGEVERLTSTAQEQVVQDLVHLKIPDGLTKEHFKSYVGALLLQVPLVQYMNEHIRANQRFGLARKYVARWLKEHGSEREPTEVWQTLIRWLLLFLPGRFKLQVMRYSEVLRER